MHTYTSSKINIIMIPLAKYTHVYTPIHHQKKNKQDGQQLPQRKLKLAICSHSILYVQNIKLQMKINSFGG